MKNIIGIFVVAIAFCFLSCEPVEKRNELTMNAKRVTDAEINNFLKVEIEQRDGKNINFVNVDSEGLKALTMFEHGLGTYIGKKARIQVGIFPGAQTIKVTILSPDGHVDTREFPINVEECHDVATEWFLLCGALGEKTWTWKTEADPDCYGMGDVFTDLEKPDTGAPQGPGWWVPAWGAGVNELEWHGATMTLSGFGSTLTKNKTDGSTESGTFSFAMNYIDEDDEDNNVIVTYPKFTRGDPENKSLATDGPFGRFYTRGITVLNGNSFADDDSESPWKSWAEVYQYEIARLTDDELVLLIVDMKPGFVPDDEGWGQATWWLFKAVD